MVILSNTGLSHEASFRDRRVGTVSHTVAQDFSEVITGL